METHGNSPNATDKRKGALLEEGAGGPTCLDLLNQKHAVDEEVGPMSQTHDSSELVDSKGSAKNWTAIIGQGAP